MTERSYVSKARLGLVAVTAASVFCLAAGGCSSGDSAEDPCEPDSCNTHGECDGTTGAPVCSCHPGYSGESCLACAEGYSDDGAGNCVEDTTCEDADGDGHGHAACGGDDCDDEDASVHPGADEGSRAVPTCTNGIDDDCDTLTDLDDAACVECGSAGDCDDADPCTRETCTADGVCSITLEPDADADADGYAGTHCAGGDDCDDADATIHPGAQDVCADGIDQDCDGCDPQCCCAPVQADGDGDGHLALCCCGDDCNDDNPDVNPGMQEGPAGDPVCEDTLDNDCDGSVDAQDPGCT